MADKRIYYRCGYKYQLREKYVHQLPLEISQYIYLAVETPFISITLSGLLTFNNGYAWDGPSGPTIDTKTFMRPSLVHDGGFQLIREGVIAQAARPHLDDELKRLCLEDGMNGFRAWYVHREVGRFGRKASIQNRDILVAP